MFSRTKSEKSNLGGRISPCAQTLPQKATYAPAKVITALQSLAENPFDSSLKTHKLKGDLTGLWACTVEYDCRIIFRFQEVEGETEEAIMAIDMGSHDDVY